MSDTPDTPARRQVAGLVLFLMQTTPHEIAHTLRTDKEWSGWGRLNELLDAVVADEGSQGNRRLTSIPKGKGAGPSPAFQLGENDYGRGIGLHAPLPMGVDPTEWARGWVAASEKV